MSDDPRLSRLFTYTVFHLGMYIPLGAVLLTIFGSEYLSEQLGIKPGSPLVRFIFAALFVAKVAGAVVATACIEHKKFDEVWKTDWRLRGCADDRTLVGQAGARGVLDGHHCVRALDAKVISWRAAGLLRDQHLSAS